MYSREFIKQLAKKNRRSQQFYRDALTEILTELQEQLKEGKAVQFIGFGTFSTRIRKEGTAMNFKTREKIKTSAVRIARFKPGTTLKRTVKKKGLISGLLSQKRGRKKK
jgi:DNA-binding protein HU-beta